MTDDTLEAQAKKLASRLGSRYCRHWDGAYCDVCSEGELITWARRLVAESRAGALREAARLARETGDYPTSGIIKLLADDIDALAAEAEPGAQDRAGKEG